MRTLGLLSLATRWSSLAFAQKPSVTAASIHLTTTRSPICSARAAGMGRAHISTRGLPSVQKPEHYVR